MDQSFVDSRKERVLCVRDALRILRAMGIQADQIREGADAFTACGAKLQALQAIEGDPDGALMTDLDEAVRDAETALLTLDRTLSTDEFRLRFDDIEISFEATPLARYARMLSAGILSDPDRRDRFELICTRLLRYKAPGGEFAISAEKDVAGLLRAIVGDHPPLDEATRKAAIEHIESNRARLATFATLDALLDSGVYLDSYGYKISLKEKILDADVLYAAVKLSVELTNVVQSLMDKEPGDALDRARDRLAQAKREARELIRQVAENDPNATAQAIERRSTKTRKISEIVVPQTRAGRVRLGIVLGVIVAVLVPFGVWSVYHFTLSPGCSITQLSPSDLLSFSGLLESGELCMLEDETVLFFGSLRADIWRKLTDGERSIEADKLRANLMRGQIRTALIKANNIIALQVDPVLGVLVFPLPKP
jgi:hypothetical protein